MTGRAAGVVLLLLVARPAWAQTQEGGLSYDLRIDIPVTAVLALAQIGFEAFKADLQPDSCRWCGRNGLDETFRDGLRWSDTGAANLTSNVLFFAAPAFAMGGLVWAAHADDRIEDWPVDALVAAETMLVVSVLTQVVKSVAARTRPYVREVPPERRFEKPTDTRSFTSGHAGVLFGAAVSSWTIAHLRRRSGASWFLVVGLPLAAAASYLRVAGDRHYLTDVLAGAALGSGLGFGLPWIFHRP